MDALCVTFPAMNQRTIETEAKEEEEEGVRGV